MTFPGNGNQMLSWKSWPWKTIAYLEEPVEELAVSPSDIASVYVKRRLTLRLTLLPAVVVLVVTCNTRNAHFVYYTVLAIFLDFLNGQFDKTRLFGSRF